MYIYLLACCHLLSTQTNETLMFFIQLYDCEFSSKLSQELHFLLKMFLPTRLSCPRYYFHPVSVLMLNKLIPEAPLSFPNPHLMWQGDGKQARGRTEIKEQGIKNKCACLAKWSGAHQQQ